MTCPFCGCDPYEYVDVGVGGRGVPVAITCCELGVEYFDPKGNSDTVEISRGQLNEFGRIFGAMRSLGLDPKMNID